MTRQRETQGDHPKQHQQMTALHQSAKGPGRCPLQWGLAAIKKKKQKTTTGEQTCSCNMEKQNPSPQPEMAPYRPPYQPHIGPVSGPIWETTLKGLLGDHPAGLSPGRLRPAGLVTLPQTGSPRQWHTSQLLRNGPCSALVVKHRDS